MGGKQASVVRLHLLQPSSKQMCGSAVCSLPAREEGSGGGGGEGISLQAQGRGSQESIHHSQAPKPGAVQETGRDRITGLLFLPFSSAWDRAGLQPPSQRAVWGGPVGRKRGEVIIKALQP